MTNEELTEIWNKTNGADSPLSTEAVFAAMRAVALGERENCAIECEGMDDRVSSGGGMEGSDCGRMLRENGWLRQAYAR